MNYFILGASGFIGKELVKALLENGHGVTALEHRSTIEIQHKNLRIIKGTLKDCVLHLDEKKTDVIIHLARISGGRYALGRFVNSMRAKRYNQRIRNWLPKNEHVRLYYLSGSLMYGNSPLPITEKNPLNPISFAKQYHIAEKPFVVDPLKNVTVLRPGWVFGNGSWFKQFFLNPILKSKKTPLYGNGINTMSIIHVRDLARLIVTYTEKKASHAIYNLCSPIRVTQTEFAESLSKKTGAEIQKLTPDEVSQRYNTTIVEAFTSNIILATDYPEMLNDFRFEYPDLENLFLSEIK